jgi:type IV pilus assembly protein PilB
VGLIRSRKEALDEFSQAIAERFADEPEKQEKPEGRRAETDAPEAAETVDDTLTPKGRRRRKRGKDDGDEGGEGDTRAAQAALKARLKAQVNTGEATDAADAGLVTASAAAQEAARDDVDPGEGGPTHSGTPLGELLVGRGMVSEEQILDALLEQSSTGKRLGYVLVELGLLKERDLVEVLAEQLQMDIVDLRHTEIDREVAQLLPELTARELNAVPIARQGGRVVIAVGDPLQDGLTGRLIEALESPVRLELATPSDVRLVIDQAYTSTAGVSDAIRVFEARAEARRAQMREGDQEEVRVDENAPIVQVVNMILEQAVRERASDVHIEPTEGRVRVRVRTDGALHEIVSLPEAMGASLLSRIKVMSDLNIVERRRPQDGQMEVTVAGKALDIRVATSSTVYGEKAVLRLLDKTRALYKLAELGMPADTYERYADLVRSPYGMVICAGPTGSGKTTTLYATLAEINNDEINVVTIEDPVEYVFPSVNQIQINEQAGVTFAAGLRSILRQDPDSILVGEIRDVETARIAVQAALTGHFVMSSLHATDATAALHRFLDMGIESFLIASSLLGVVGQRLTRRICPHCKETYQPTTEELDFYERGGGDPEKREFVHGVGCNFCGSTGYFDRVGIYEVLRMTDEMRQLVVENAPQEKLKGLAVEQGMRTLREQAIRLVETDETTIAEVLRTVYIL